MRAAVYARVSTTHKGQDVDLQLRDLRAYVQARRWTAAEYVDNGVSGVKDNRSEFKRLLTDAKQRKFDVVVVWKLDRFGRSLSHLLNTLNELQDLGVSFVSLKEALDFTTAAGKLMAHILGAFAQFERDLISERVKAGIANAKAKGKRHGRKPFPPVMLRKIIEAYEGKGDNGNRSVRDISVKTRISKSTVQRILIAYKNGLLDREGFPHEKSLSLVP